MTRRARNTCLLAAVAACLGLSACGGDDTGDPIPSGKATRLNERLDAVQQAIENDCESVATRIQAVQMTAGSLDEDGVGDDVQDAVVDGIDNLRDLADRECALQSEEEPETTPETTPETIPEPVPTTPEPTTPEPTTPEPTTPEPTTPEPLPPEEEEPDEGDGGAQFEPDGKVPPGQLKKDRDG